MCRVQASLVSNAPVVSPPASVGAARFRITHHGRPAGTLRGAAAARFLTDVQDDDPQQLMARLTGNYKHGNERLGSDHPRNQGGR